MTYTRPVQNDGGTASGMWWIAFLVLALSACGGGTDDALPESFIRLSVDESDAERLLRYYFGGYVSPEPADPFEAGILHQHDGRTYADLEAFERHLPGATEHLSDVSADGVLDADEFEAFIDSTYTDARAAPDLLDEFRRSATFEASDPAWMRVDVNGPMTTALRRIYVREDALREALRAYRERGDRIIYPVETTFVAEHHLDGLHVETTAMRKRKDGFWDYFVYDAEGKLAPRTSTPPRELKSPIQCVGCHFGDRLFEPERSFPGRAEPGPHGPRMLYVDEDLRDPEVVRRFDEHRRRSDTILGLYGTLFVSKLRAARREGALDSSDAALLENLNL